MININGLVIIYFLMLTQVNQKYIKSINTWCKIIYCIISIYTQFSCTRKTSCMDHPHAWSDWTRKLMTQATMVPYPTPGQAQKSLATRHRAIIHHHKHPDSTSQDRKIHPKPMELISGNQRESNSPNCFLWGGRHSLHTNMI